MAEAARVLRPLLPEGPLARGREDRVGVDGERERSDLTLSTPPTPQHHRAPLRASDRLLARWLRGHLQTAGAEAMLRKYGARRILDALRDGIVHSTPTPTSWGSTRYTCTLNPALRSPGGFLRRYLEQQELAD